MPELDTIDEATAVTMIRDHIRAHYPLVYMGAKGGGVNAKDRATPLPIFQSFADHNFALIPHDPVKRAGQSNKHYARFRDTLLPLALDEYYFESYYSLPDTKTAYAPKNGQPAPKRALIPGLQSASRRIEGWQVLTARNEHRKMPLPYSERLVANYDGEVARAAVDAEIESCLLPTTVAANIGVTGDRAQPVRLRLSVRGVLVDEPPYHELLLVEEDDGMEVEDAPSLAAPPTPPALTEVAIEECFDGDDDVVERWGAASVDERARLTQYLLSEKTLHVGAAWKEARLGGAIRTWIKKELAKPRRKRAGPPPATVQKRKRGGR